MTPFAVFTPELAAGAAVAAVGVPLIIHLLFRKRYQVVPWAAIRFLLVAERRHRRRIDQWLLLALRVLALLLPLFAMLAATNWAEPLWQAIRPGATETIANVPRTHHVIVLDASLSMTTRGEDGKSRFEKAVAQGERIIQAAERGDGFTLLVLANGIEPVIPGPSNEPEKVLVELRKVKPTHGPADAAVAIHAVADALQRGKRAYPRKQVTFLTDLQRSGWANVPPRPDAELSEEAKQVFKRDDVDVVLVDLARGDADNLAVADVSLADPLPFVDSPALVTAVLANHGRVEKRDVVVQLLVGHPASPDALAVAEQQKVTVIRAHGRITVNFGVERPLRFREKGLHVLQVKFLEPDQLPADDSRTLAFPVRDALRVLIVDGKPDPMPSRRGGTSLRRALLPDEASAAFTPARPQVITPDEFLNPVADYLSNVDCIYLCDVPAPGAELAAKLDRFLKRGGAVVVGLGPSSAGPASRAEYNRYFFNEGNGILPSPLGEIVTVANLDDPGLRLYAEEEDYRRAPLKLFLDEKVRGGLIMAPFKSYVRLEPPPQKSPPVTPSPEIAPEGAARRVLSFSSGSQTGVHRRDDPAVVEWTRHRGRVILFTSSFNEDWNDWPPLPSYLMFQQELLRFAAANPDRHTLRVGDAIEEFYPAKFAGATATITGPGSLNTSVSLSMHEEGAFASFRETALSGLYRIRVSDQPDRVFAVNVPESAAGSNGGTGSESDLKQLELSELKPLGSPQIVTDVGDVKPTPQSGAEITSAPKPHGPAIARFAVLLALAILALEMFISWRWGPSRAAGAGTATGSARPVERRPFLRVLSTLGALIPLAAAAFIIATLIHYESTGELLGFLPQGLQEEIQRAAGVPQAQPGEGTKWRLERFTAFARSGLTDSRIVLALAVVGAVFSVLLYRRERRVVARFSRLVVPTLLRTAVFLVALFVLLPQLRLAFDREGWPDVAIILDTSASMDTKDDFKDPAILAKAKDLAGATPLSEVDRLMLARYLLTRKTNDADWLDRLLKEKEVRVHVYALDADKRLVNSINEPADIESTRSAILKLTPNGESSRLGDGVEKVLKDFRGRSLAAIIMFTDGRTTAGDDLPHAARAAAAADVPLHLLGVGDVWERPDLEITDLRAEETIPVGNRLVFDARVAAHGQIPPGPVTVTLTEKGLPPEKARLATVTVNPGTGGNRVPVTLAHTPLEPGEKTFILEVTPVEGEIDRSNNRIERTVLVTDSKRIRVLYLEGYPRYDFRFVKVMLERESDKSIGGKGVEVRVVLLNASPGWETTDRSAYSTGMPTREELFGFDVVVLGDVDPKQLTRSAGVLQNLVDFVKVKGGGLLFLSGEHGTPAAWVDTPLAEILPVIADPNARPRGGDDATIAEGYRPRVTDSGKQHPLFRFSPDASESAAIWQRLQPLYWFAKDYRRKPNTVVLAVHPDVPATGGAPGENHPLAIQAFTGAGPVLFLGFDDTWRWRFRNDEEHFDHFWREAIQVLSQSRVRRVELSVSPKTDFRRDEKMTIVVRFPIESPAPPPGQPVRVNVVRRPLPNRTGSAETGTLTLARVQGSEVRYETTLTRTPEGEYHFTLEAPEPQSGISAPTAVARVLPPLKENERVELNKADLMSAAALSQGKFYTLADADSAIDDLQHLDRVPLNQPCPPVELWNSAWVYLLLVMLLGSEWLLRKRERLL